MGPPPAPAPQMTLLKPMPARGLGHIDAAGEVRVKGEEGGEELRLVVEDTDLRSAARPAPVTM